jgi:hypothetical protein
MLKKCSSNRRILHICSYLSINSISKKVVSLSLWEFKNGLMCFAYIFIVKAICSSFEKSGPSIPVSNWFFLLNSSPLLIFLNASKNILDISFSISYILPQIYSQFFLTAVYKVFVWRLMHAIRILWARVSNFPVCVMTWSWLI